ncbi:prion-like-(Q/N-rich) domain-bearing protein 25 isoform X2 [Cydia amplana]|uniref:prion-like-(Q/N-rich) domain-bearing protein 25 isoform X2 n=1 Tax=Cydia amplana TaxID=1869771 RepID=UPI002FE60ADB
MGFPVRYVASRPSAIMHAQAVLALALYVAANVQRASAQAPEKRRTGNVCSTDPECPDNAFCKSGTYCVCKDGFIYAATENAEKACLKVASFGDHCQQHIQCHTSLGVHSECLLNTCSCKPGTQFVNNRCYKIAHVGELCISDENCYIQQAIPEEQAFCIRGYCQCQLHYNQRDNGTRCVRDANLGEACEDDGQCAGVGMVCKGTCRCKEGFAAQNDTNVCLQSVENIGDSCEYDIQCENLSGSRAVGATMCLNGACSCAYHARAAGTPPRCYVTRRPGQQCHADEECLSEDDEPGFCHQGRCTCAGCVPDARDFADHASSLAPLPLCAAILATAAILA